MTHLNSEIKSIEKLSKSKDKEIYNQKRVVESTRDTLKNLKAKLSNANICRTRLESENRKLKKQLEKKESQHVYFKENSNPVQLVHPTPSPIIMLEASTPIPFSSTSEPPSLPSMVSYWNPSYVETQQRPESTISMIAHLAKHPNSDASDKPDDTLTMIAEAPLEQLVTIEKKEIELEDKEDGFIGPRLPRVMTKEEVEALFRELFPNSEKYK